MQALSERLDAALAGGTLAGIDVLGFASLKTVAPEPADLTGTRLESVRRRGKFALFNFPGRVRVVLHLSQAGRIDLEVPPKATRPRGALVRLRFRAPDAAVLVREHGTQRKAGWWVLGPGDDGPLVGLGPEPDDPAFAALVHGEHGSRRLYTWLRDQHVVAGIGRGCTDDALHRAQLSPFASIGSLDASERDRLLDAVRRVLADGLEAERRRTGGLSAPRLGEHFAIHGRVGEPCPRCKEPLRRVSFDSYDLTYCTCQTGGTVLADRRMSRLLR